MPDARSEVRRLLFETREFAEDCRIGDVPVTIRVGFMYRSLLRDLGVDGKRDFGAGMELCAVAFSESGDIVATRIFPDAVVDETNTDAPNKWENRRRLGIAMFTAPEDVAGP